MRWILDYAVPAARPYAQGTLLVFNMQKILVPFWLCQCMNM